MPLWPVARAKTFSEANPPSSNTSAVGPPRKLPLDPTRITSPFAENPLSAPLPAMTVSSTSRLRIGVLLTFPVLRRPWAGLSKGGPNGWVPLGNGVTPTAITLSGMSAGSCTSL